MPETNLLPITEKMIANDLGGDSFAHYARRARRAKLNEMGTSIVTGPDGLIAISVGVPFLRHPIEIRIDPCKRGRYFILGSELERVREMRDEFDTSLNDSDPLAIALRGLPLNRKSVITYLAAHCRDFDEFTANVRYHGGARAIKFRRLMGSWQVSKQSAPKLIEVFSGHVSASDFVNGYGFELEKQRPDGFVPFDIATAMQAHIQIENPMDVRITKAGKRLQMAVDDERYWIYRENGVYFVKFPPIPNNRVRTLTFRGGNAMVRVPGGFVEVPYSQLGEGCERFLSLAKRPEMVRRWAGVEADMGHDTKSSRHKLRILAQHTNNPFVHLEDRGAFTKVGIAWKLVTRAKV